MRKIVYTCLCAAAAAMFLTSCGGTPRGGEDPQSSAAASVTRSDQEDGEETKEFEESPEFDSTRMLSADSREFCGVYLKAGDPSYRIEVKPGGRRNRIKNTHMIRHKSGAASAKGGLRLYVEQRVGSS